MCEVSHLDQLWLHHVCRVSDVYFQVKDTAVISFMMCMQIASSETDCSFIILDMDTCWFFFFLTATINQYSTTGPMSVQESGFNCLGACFHFCQSLEYIYIDQTQNGFIILLTRVEIQDSPKG